MNEWSPFERLTLRLGPVWVMSALCGRCRFDSLEQEAFWSTVEDVAGDVDGLARDVLVEALGDRRWLFDEFELDSRPIVSGLSQVVTLLERVDLDSSSTTRRALLDVGHGVARARGPFGRRESLQDAQTLLLVAQLLQTMSETADHNPLNSDLPL